MPGSLYTQTSKFSGRLVNSKVFGLLRVLRASLTIFVALSS
jgi:hypothetical protein